MNEPCIEISPDYFGTEVSLTYRDALALIKDLQKQLKERQPDFIEFCRYKEHKLESALAEFKRINPEYANDKPQTNF